MRQVFVSRSCRTGSPAPCLNNLVFVHTYAAVYVKEYVGFFLEHDGSQFEFSGYSNLHQFGTSYLHQFGNLQKRPNIILEHDGSQVELPGFFIQNNAST